MNNEIVIPRFALSVLLAQAQFPYAEIDFRRDVAETEKTVYFLGPTKHIFGGKVTKVAIAADDQRVAFTEKTANGFSARVWNRKTGAITKIVDTAFPTEVVFQNSAALWITPTYEGGPMGPSAIFRYDLASSRIEEVARAEKGRMDLDLAYDSNSAMVLFHGGELGLVVYVSGRSAQVSLPAGIRYIRADWGFGIPAVTVAGEKLEGEYAIDLDSGTLGNHLNPATRKDPPMYQHNLAIASAKFKLGTNTVSGHWLVAYDKEYPATVSEWATAPPASLPKPRDPEAFKGLIAADQTSARLGLKNTVVAYWDRHNLFIREIKSMPADDFNALFEEYEKRVLSDQAKQVGVAMRIYTGDSDDLLPINDGTFDRLLPYSKDSSIFDNFQYGLGSQNLKDIKNPGETVMGRINGRNGRAIVFVDGRVIWEPRKKKA